MILLSLFAIFQSKIKQYTITLCLLKLVFTESFISFKLHVINVFQIQIANESLRRTNRILRSPVCNVDNFVVISFLLLQAMRLISGRKLCFSLQSAIICNDWFINKRKNTIDINLNSLLTERRFIHKVHWHYLSTIFSTVSLSSIACVVRMFIVIKMIVSLRTTLKMKHVTLR